MGPVKSFSRFLRHVVLAEIEEQVVIFIDEIDTTLNLPFSDDFFAAIRAAYNTRAKDPAYNRLTFVLFGVATPSDLIKDRSRAPFNIGQGIDLEDFSQENTRALQQGLKDIHPENGQEIFDHIYFWTNGHPYLTQKLCLAAAEIAPTDSPVDTVDDLVGRLFLSDEARKESNLQFIRDSIQTSPNRRDLLTVYRDVYLGKSVPDDERSVVQNQLKLFGLLRAENGELKIRNEVYRQVFNLEWIDTNLPVDWTRRIAIISTVLTLILIGLVGFSIYWQSRQDRAQNLIDQFRNTTDPNIRITSLAGLFDLPGFGPQAQQLFYEEMTPEDRLGLFDAADPQTVGTELITAVQGLYTDLENSERDNTLLRAMQLPLQKINDPRALNLQVGIEQWLEGRQYYDRELYQQAVAAYNVVIRLNDRNPGVYFDRGLAYVAQNDSEKALADFETVLALDPTRNRRVEQVIINTPALYESVIAQGTVRPAIAAIVPTPTNTPTPTATPRPAKVVYVQGNGPNHQLGFIEETGVVVATNLHPRASAPSWSPDGRRVAFFGESGISELGGIYGQGSGIWVLELETGDLELVFSIDYIRNMDWAPGGKKLAAEIGPPGITHQILVVDMRDGQEIGRFPGEQPAWSPDSQELVIKSCAPECGLWKVGFDGGGGELLTGDSTDSYPTWSSDGRYIVFTSRARTGDWEIYRLELAGGDIIRLTNRPGTDTTPTFSPDGLEIYLRTDTSGRGWRITALSVDGLNERIVIDDVGPSDDWGLARPAVY